MHFRRKKRISDRNAYHMVEMMAKHGNHYNDIYGQLKSINDIKLHCLQNGYEFKNLVNGVRDFSKKIPMYENLVSAQTFIQNATVLEVSHITGETENVMSGIGSYNEKDYWANFDISREDFEGAIKSGNFERLLSAVNAGISSVEAFLNFKYMKFYKAKSDDPNLRIPLEEKIKDWPKIITGNPMDLSTKSWASFVQMKKLRDELFQHRKSLSSGIQNSDHLKYLNMYKLAIPRLMLEMHIHFFEKCPSSIIRYSYFPEIETYFENFS